MSGSRESLLSRLYGGASEQQPHGDNYSYSVYYLHNHSAVYKYTIQPSIRTE